MPIELGQVVVAAAFACFFWCLGAVTCLPTMHEGFEHELAMPCMSIHGHCHCHSIQLQPAHANLLQHALLVQTAQTAGIHWLHKLQVSP
jgi:hypothetical protein